MGLKRPNNEDQFLIADLHKSMRVQQTSLNLDDQTRLFSNSQGMLLLVADGMGGHAAGELASQIAVDSITAYLLNAMHWFLRLDHEGEDDFLDDLKLAMEHGQNSILQAAKASPDRRGMGTTLTMAYLIWPRLYVVHAGDSRCYLLRDSQLRQITNDHTMAQQLVEQGRLGAKEAESSRWSNILLKAIGGGDEKVNAEVHKIDLTLGDTLLLCTDGLHKQVADDEIRRVLGSNSPAAENCERLVEMANTASGVDNVTVVVCRFQQGHAEQLVAEQAEPLDRTVKTQESQSGLIDDAALPVG